MNIHFSVTLFPFKKHRLKKIMSYKECSRIFELHRLELIEYLSFGLMRVKVFLAVVIF
jgi:hypothetical protein